jgi:predicted acetyltransferase
MGYAHKYYGEEIFNSPTTDPSSVYIMTHENLPDASKIGVSVNPEQRKKQIAKWTSKEGRVYNYPMSVAWQSQKVKRQLAEAVEHLAQAYAIVKCGQIEELPETIVSGRSEFFQCSIKQAIGFIAIAFKMAKKLNNNVLKIAQYAKQYVEQKLEYLPINMARWMSQI